MGCPDSSKTSTTISGGRSAPNAGAFSHAITTRAPTLTIAERVGSGRSPAGRDDVRRAERTRRPRSPWVERRLHERGGDRIRRVERHIAVRHSHGVVGRAGEHRPKLVAEPRRRELDRRGERRGSAHAAPHVAGRRRRATDPARRRRRRTSSARGRVAELGARAARGEPEAGHQDRESTHRAIVRGICGGVAPTRGDARCGTQRERSRRQDAPPNRSLRNRSDERVRRPRRSSPTSRRGSKAPSTTPTGAGQSQSRWS